MHRSALWVALILAGMACTSDPGPPPEPPAPADPFPVTIRGAEACSEVLEPPIQEGLHVELIEQLDNHTTDPPTSGKHFTSWADPGIYPNPVPDGNQVHNLEHGHVVVQYRDLTDEELDAIRAPVLADPFMMLMAPRPTMPWKLALTSWGRIQVCQRIPEDPGDLVRAFIAQNRDSGVAPESIP